MASIGFTSFRSFSSFARSTFVSIIPRFSITPFPVSTSPSDISRMRMGASGERVQRSAMSFGSSS